MAKITGPLMSMTASGTFANLLTFSNNQNGAFIKRFAGNSKIKNRVPSTLQFNDRYNFKKANAFYKVLTNEEHIKLNSLYYDKTQSARNVIFRQHILNKPAEIGFFDLGSNYLGSIF